MSFTVDYDLGWKDENLKHEGHSFTFAERLRVVPVRVPGAYALDHRRALL